MAITDLSYIFGPVGPLRTERSVDISSDDFEDTRGFLVQAGGAGTITYTTLEGDRITKAVTQGVVLGVGNFPVVCTQVDASSTIGTIIVGFF